MEIIPFTSDPAQGFDVALGDDLYTFAARWREANGDDPGGWTFDLTRASDQVLLLSSVPILLGQDMLAPYALGIGGLIASDMDGKGVDAGPDDLGERVVVSWLSPAELADLKAQGAAL